MGICHRDLRVQNMLLDNLGNLKISDFGHAGIFKKGINLLSRFFFVILLRLGHIFHAACRLLVPLVTGTNQ